jgi:hypothetical protein
MKKICLILSLFHLFFVSVSAQTYCVTATKVSETATTITVSFSLTGFNATTELIDGTILITGGGSISGSTGNIGISGNIPGTIPLSGSYTFNKVASGSATFSVNDASPYGIAYTITTPMPAIVPVISNCSVNSIVLPLELISFTASKDKNSLTDKAIVRWETVQEKDLDIYIVERSLDGKKFFSIGEVKPKGKKETDKMTYIFEDESPEAGINYYRLLSRDLDKTKYYSKIVSVEFASALKPKIFPNPFDSELKLELEIEQWLNSEVNIDLFDTAGKQLLNKKITAQGKKLNIDIPTEELPVGSYIIRVKNGSNIWQYKVTKVQ